MSRLLRENGLEPLDCDDRRETLSTLPVSREPVAPEGSAHSAHARGVRGALLTIIDNRDGRIPSQRFNSFDLISTTDLDIDCIEVSPGPGSASYGPNAAAGVMHIITASPIDRPGTSVSLAGGERSISSSQSRSADAFSGRFGIRVSGQYMRGNDFEFQDPIEVAAAALSTSPGAYARMPPEQQRGVFSYTDSPTMDGIHNLPFLRIPAPYRQPLARIGGAED